MNRPLKKDLKPFALKLMALIMGICYLANPMHQQIRTVFHGISHLLEVPDSFLSHHSHNTNYASEVHEQNEHSLVNATDHRHTLLDLMDAIFDASNGQHPEEDTELVFINCDKHISSPLIILPKTFAIFTSQNTSSIKQKVKIGYLFQFKEPPQKLSI